MVLAIAAKIKVPFYPVPMTLQTLAVLGIAATYGSRLAVITVLAYLAQGALGLPVFTNTPPAVAGPAYFMGPTGGFLLGFVVMAWNRRRRRRSRLGPFLPEAARRHARRRCRDAGARLRLARLVRDAVERGDRPRCFSRLQPVAWRRSCSATSSRWCSPRPRCPPCGACSTAAPDPAVAHRRPSKSRPRAGTFRLGGMWRTSTSSY